MIGLDLVYKCTNINLKQMQEECLFKKAGSAKEFSSKQINEIPAIAKI